MKREEDLSTWILELAVGIFIMLILLLACTGCSSHISRADGIWVVQHAKTIDDVYDRLGAPEREAFSPGSAEATWYDRGTHLHWLAVIPGVNIVALPFWLIETIFFKHPRTIVVRYDERMRTITHIEAPFGR